MVKTKKNTTKKNTTKKNVLSPTVLKLCPVGLKPFEEEYNKTSSKSQLKKTSKIRTKTVVKELLTKFAPNNIKPEDDFYDYINYDWLQNVSLEDRQKYIVQIDDFRLAQDKVYLELNDPTKAERYFKEAIIVNKQDFYAFFNLGVLYFNNNNLQEALNYMKQSISLNFHFRPSSL